MDNNPTDPIPPAVPGLPLLAPTPVAWARLADRHLDRFLADHAFCEQQAALTALNLSAHYPGDAELVDRMTALAAEEVSHLRRVCSLLHRRGLQMARRRSNPWVRELRSHMETDREPALKIDRLLVGALVEARSCERFKTLAEVVRDPEVVSLLGDLGPAEERHWQMFHRLAAREIEPADLDRRWRRWLEIERDAAGRCGRSPTVHG